MSLKNPFVFKEQLSVKNAQELSDTSFMGGQATLASSVIIPMAKGFEDQTLGKMLDEWFAAYHW